MNDNLSHIRGVIWDLDGTLYRFNELFRQACNIAAARTAIDLGLTMPLDKAVALAAKSERIYGSSFKLFADHGIRYEDFHLPYHAAIDTTILEKNLEMRRTLESIGMPMVILTNASRGWALKTLKHLDMKSVFDDKHILALEDVGYKGKSESTQGFERALRILNKPSEEVLMVEDLSANLIKAKQMGMTTALVHHGQMPNEAAHIDHLFQNTLDLAHRLTQVKAA